LVPIAIGIGTSLIRRRRSPIFLFFIFNFLFLISYSCTLSFCFSSRKFLPYLRASKIIFMGLQAGIVGLPNVGKSTLFNAVSNSAKAQASNYRFCTIEPNIGLVDVPDKRLVRLAELVLPNRIVPTQIEIVDIAGLVKGASKGEGLGNKFLANMREVDAIIHVI